MRGQSPIDVHKSQVLELALRKQQLVERIARLGRIDEFGDDVMRTDEK